MRRITMALGALCAVGTLALAVPGTASAASGVMVINQQAYANPNGCFAGNLQPLYIANSTNEIAYVYAAANCSGPLVGVVTPGRTAVVMQGASVFVR
ncbi:MAG TPA: hypothetical protein VIR33_02405 [Thermopolyspora sp.]|jgi:hypothetical protein